MAAALPPRCPCCGCKALDERGGYEIGTICFWEDDGQDDHNADVVRGGTLEGKVEALIAGGGRQGTRAFGQRARLVARGGAEASSEIFPEIRARG